EGGAGVQIQVAVAAPDDTGRRTLRIYSRPDTTNPPHTDWTLHADGTLAPASRQAPAPDLTQWPPPGATALTVDDAYDTLLRQGYAYGPVFQGLKAAWHDGDDVYAEVTLPDGESTDQAPRFGIHPALLDAAMHALSVGETGDEPTLLPYSWSGVSLRAMGTSAVRVRLSRPGENKLSMQLADMEGRPVGSVDVLALRPVSAAQLAADTEGDSLFRIEWEPLLAPPAATGADAPALLPWRDLPTEGPVPGTILYECPAEAADDGPLAAARSTAYDTLSVVQQWLAQDRFADARLIVTTRNAAHTEPGTELDLGQYPVWGLLRAAQAENPGRFQLIDLDDAPESRALLPAAVASGEPEAAIHHGRILLPRWARASGMSGAAGTADGPTALSGFGADGTVLVTGGTGGLGAALARHLVAEHGVRHLLLVSRRGPEATGASELEKELAAAGAEVTITACDVADRDDLAALLAAVPAEHPLTGIVHTAGVVHNGVIGSWTPESVDATFAPKVNGAWHLHELTRHLDLRAFVLYSSAGGMVLAQGQAGYAAANVFLDGLALERQRLGLPAISLAWGAWAVDMGMSRELSEIDLQRMESQGLPAFSVEDGLALFDAALATGESVVAPVRLNTAALRGRPGVVPALLRRLVRVPVRLTARGAAGEATGTELVGRLSRLSAAERESALLEIVRTHAASVLGHGGAEAIDPERGFLDIGFDSLSALEMRNRMVTVAGRNLAPMLVFDHPSATALARYLQELLFHTEDPGVGADLEAASAEDLFAILDEELETRG
ncbi:type I polyketide synthase, partial [Streptomyces sp. NPDC019531]|uniref:type I polyketide synthase n=1 Tax=Streptomyces sp. NPDC019531 TaxID=3365062 RepID=UPI00384CBF3E